MTTSPSTVPGATPSTSDLETCAAILELLYPVRRAADPDAPNTAAAFPEQINQLLDFVSVGEPVMFTLPGFPCKSPNPAKVLGDLPDEGERLSLRFLDELCASVQAVYAPGARLVICSDGHIFGDVIGVADDRVDAYSDELRELMAKEELSRLSLFNLQDIYPGLSYDEKRRRVTVAYAPTIAQLREEVMTDESTLRLYRGITRFLVDDTAHWTGSKSALQRECRTRSYEVIARSRAWGDLVAAYHPRSVRLSIHPQPAGAAKFGIRLLDAPDAWMTPWHSVLVEEPGKAPRLVRHKDAVELGELVTVDGRPSHFRVTD
ncbi:PvcA protein, related to known isonitrile synthases [Alloactinosynnema sp. L-07]|uniref:L-tyrosine/L-tryptophan isonitrile synthase family protein n=1 Tax=Alloactinosynnema sp. L-07 TaxID=1653480 RepID=UPI00065EF19C|nr:isocyanide synthase family protein [Alloactinosynnema sp. L-07]CRK57529.1 PvcA protein, related to known isonitrile synthases [Alloactinosynnema sp. L-07]